jgi:Peptidase family M23/Bacterial pre-peptidase C-terminal domain/FG-GAP-like repeat
MISALRGFGWEEVVAVSNGFRQPLGNGNLTEAIDGDGFHVETNFNQYNPGFNAYHLGEDWNADGPDLADLGMPVYAISNGTVVEKGVLESFGNYLIIRHDLPAPITVNGITTSAVYSLYGHFQNPAIVSVGDVVGIGQQIGNVGYTGDADGNSHVHLEIRLGTGAGYENTDGYSFGGAPPGWVDPTDFINSHRTLTAPPDLAGNTLATARVVTLGGASSSYTDYVGPTDTSDYYKFATTDATNFALSLTGLTGDADVYLLNSGGTEVAHSYNSGTTPEAINVNNLAAGTYYVQVRPYQTASTNYTLALSAAPGQDDLAGNMLATARVVTLGSLSSSYTDYVGPTDTSDYYKFTTTAATNFALSLTGLTGDADVYLLNSGGTEVAHSYNNGTAPEAINVNNLAAGTYYIQVRPYQTASTNYTLSASADPVQADLAGNTLATARVVTLGSASSTYIDYVGPSDTSDYYKFTTTAATNFALSLTGLTGDADVYLLNSGGIEVTHSYNFGTTPEAINVNNLAAGTYYIQVRPYQTASTNYTLGLSAAPVAQSSTSAATFVAHDENLTQTGASAIEGTRDALPNVIIGNGGDGPIVGGAAADSETVSGLPPANTVTDLGSGTVVSGPNGTETPTNVDAPSNVDAPVVDDATVTRPPPAPAVPPVPSIAAGFYGDLNGDHNSDVVLHRGDGAVALWQMNGAQVQNAHLVGSVGAEWSVESTADFNADGRADVMWRASAGTVMIWTMNGDQIQDVHTVGSVGNEWHINGAGDLDGDRFTDLVWRSDAGTLMLWKMSGAQIQSVQFFGQVGNDWHIVGIGDFNGDGRSDLLWRGADGKVLDFQMNDTQIQSAQEVGSLGLDWHVEGVGDFNGDGRSDILWRNDAGALLEFQMNGAQIQSAQTIGSRTVDWHVYGTGDFDGDGKADILWRNDDGTVDLWTMNGAEIAAAKTVTLLGNDWTLGVHHYDLI